METQEETSKENTNHEITGLEIFKDNPESPDLLVTKQEDNTQNEEDEITRSIKTLVRVLIAIEAQYQEPGDNQTELNQAA